jgi:hypothetical protein
MESFHLVAGEIAHIVLNVCHPATSTPQSGRAHFANPNALLLYVILPISIASRTQH